MEEKYGVCPIKAVLEEVRRLNEVEEVVRIAASAAFFEERLESQWSVA